MDKDGFGRLRAYLDGVSGGSCTLPFERMRELTGEPLPEEAATEAWWIDPAGSDAWPPSSALQAAGWHVESAHPSALLVRLAGDRRKAADARAAGRKRPRVVGSVGETVDAGGRLPEGMPDSDGPPLSAGRSV